MKIKEELCFLTDKQKQVFSLRNEGKKYKEIAEILGSTEECARQHFQHAERRIREYEHYNEAKQRNTGRVDFPLTRGELKIIYEGLQLVDRNMTRHVRLKDDWLGKMSYEYQVMKQLLEKVNQALYSSEVKDGD